jgi:hypothetical protein
LRTEHAVVLRSQRNKRQADAELVEDLLDGERSFDGHGHASMPSKRSDAELVEAAARRERRSRSARTRIGARPISSRPGSPAI